MDARITKLPRFVAPKPLNVIFIGLFVKHNPLMHSDVFSAMTAYEFETGITYAVVQGRQNAQRPPNAHARRRLVATGLKQH